MIVPKYWSESTIKKTREGKSFSIKRFGWSDESEQAAQRHAELRLQDALNTLEQQGDVRRLDHKVAYNGAEGIPIREEVVATHGDVVISRNAYGALCLNTPDVLFADMDFNYQVSGRLYWMSLLPLLFGALWLGLYFESWSMFASVFLGSLLAAVFIAKLLHLLVLRITGGHENLALKRIRHVSEKDPALHMRVYRTPKGMRVLVMNDTFSPTSERALNLLSTLKSDPVYIQMCKNQACFRARVSPKPWRIGLPRIQPGSGIWPIKPERMPERNAWVDRYTRTASTFSACHYVMTVGSSTIANKANLVRRVHDELSRAELARLELA